MLCTYALKSFVGKLTEIKVNDDGITYMEKFAGKITDITIKNFHTWVCKVYVLDSRVEGNVSGLPNW